MWSTHRKGEEAELQVLLRATRAGITVSRPTTESRYDLVFDIGGRLLRVQVKYADKPPSKAEGAIEVDLRAQTRNRGPQRPYSRDEVDLVLVYLPELDEVLEIGPDLFDGKKSLTFRLDPPKNGAGAVRMVYDHLWFPEGGDVDAKFIGEARWSLRRIAAAGFSHERTKREREYLDRLLEAQRALAKEHQTPLRLLGQRA